MGREARVRKQRNVREANTIVYANAREVREESKVQSLAKRLGLVLPSIVKPSVQIIKLPSDD